MVGLLALNLSGPMLAASEATPVGGPHPELCAGTDDEVDLPECAPPFA